MDAVSELPDLAQTGDVVGSALELARLGEHVVTTGFAASGNVGGIVGLSRHGNSADKGADQSSRLHDVETSDISGPRGVGVVCVGLT